MNKLFKTLSILAAITLFITACSAQTVQGEQVPAKTVTYKDVLGKSLNDKEVVDFIDINNCSSAAQFQLCKDVGMALWLGSGQRVETVCLYLNNVDGFASYKGELPLGLKFYDIKEAVEYKLKRKDVGNAGLPDEGSSPDHLHYWAMYKQAGMTIIYNSPLPEDEDASIYAILISK